MFHSLKTFIHRHFSTSSIKFKRNILSTFHERGMLNDVFPKESTQNLAEYLESSSRKIYAGFDPTAPSLHLGNLFILTSLLHCQRAGHTPIALIGGATGIIGDPSGKVSERPLMDQETILENIEGIKNDIRKIFENHETYFNNSEKKKKFENVVIVNNADWYKNVNILDFFRTVGRNMRMGRMLSRESVKSRLERTAADGGMSFTEFSYQAFQSNDWLHLMNEFDCRIQIGGSDQMGNIFSGVELIKRMTKTQVFGVTLPLIKSESGNKFGKSSGNALWLNPEMTSPFDLYQYIIRLSDADATKFLPFLSLSPMKEINDLIKSAPMNANKRRIQEKLASDVTLLVHGQSGLDLANNTTSLLYDNNIQVLADMTVDNLREIFTGKSDYIRLLYEPGMSLLELSMKIGCFKTDRDAQRIIDSGGFYVNQVQRKNFDEVIVPTVHILSNNNITLVRVGKKRYYIVEWTF